MADYGEQHGIGQMSKGELSRFIQQEINQQPTPQGRQERFDVLPPIVGSWNRGAITWNTQPAPGLYFAWVCTESGSPGTWRGVGVIT